MPTSATPKTVTAVLVVALLFQLAFAASYVGAFHSPTPHDVPVAIVGDGAAQATKQLNAIEGRPLDARTAPSMDAAKQLVRAREVYAIYEPASYTLTVASAANRATAQILETTFNRISAAQSGPAVKVVELTPLPSADSTGSASFYTVIAWVFGGYFGATLLGLIGTSRSRSRGLALQRLGAMAAYSLLAGVVSVLLLNVAFGVLDTSTVKLMAVGALTVFTSGAATIGLQAALGMVGTGLAILLFVIVGNAASGGAYARPLLPEFWSTIGGILPPGAAEVERVAQQVDTGAHTTGAILALLGWAAIGAALAVGFGGRVQSPETAEAEAAAAAAL